MAIAMAVGVGACQEPDEQEVRGPLRVSAGHQLTCFHVQSGSSAYARELVSPFATEHAQLEDLDATRVALRPHDGSPAERFCARVYADHARGVTQTYVEDGACIVEFDSPETRKTQGKHLRMDGGLYRLGREVPLGGAGGSPCTVKRMGESASAPLLARIELHSKQPRSIDEIHLVAMPLQEQWRRLFAREIDVVASMPTMYHARFLEMQSVRTVRLPSSNAMTLYFNTRAGAWSTSTARRGLAAALDLDAISRVACRDPECRSLGPFTVDLASGLASGLESEPGRDTGAGLPASISISVMADDSTGVKAAEVISYQLRKQFHVAVRLDRRPVTEFGPILESGEFDLLLLPLHLPGTAQAHELLERIQVSGWRDADFDQAVHGNQDERIAAILHAELPVLPLFRYMQFAAIDERYCGAKPTSETSWRWLADLHPCAEAGRH